jgi:rubrerythrin
MGDIIKYIDEAIKLELNVSKIYSIFSTTCPEDRSFWYTLSMEEINHASLLRSEKMFYTVNAFPDELFADDLEELIKINESFYHRVEQFMKSPSREEAFKISLELEKSGIEMHYKKLTENEGNSRAVKLFKDLNRADKDHMKRILDYMDSLNL